MIHLVKFIYLILFCFFRKSVDLCQQIEATGVSFITVHGRTAIQKNEPIDQECLKLINESVSVPVILNGDIKSLSDAITMQEYTGCRGNKIILIICAYFLICNMYLFVYFRNDECKRHITQPWFVCWPSKYSTLGCSRLVKYQTY